MRGGGGGVTMLPVQVVIVFCGENGVGDCTRHSPVVIMMMMVSLVILVASGDCDGYGTWNDLK